MSRIKIWNIIIPVILLGAILNLIAYYSIAPNILFSIYVGLTLIFMRIFGKFCKKEYTGILLVFAIHWFWAGVSAVFLEHISVNSQGPDIWYFYDVVTDHDFIPIQEGAVVQNAGSIFIWKIVYKYSELLGIDAAIYVGVTFNVSLMAITALIGSQIVKNVFPNDVRRMTRFFFIYSGCGIFWLFGSTHLRDSMALFLVTFLLLFYMRYLIKSTPINFIQLIIANVAALFIFGLVRTEYVFVPFAFLLAGITAKLNGQTGTPYIKLILIGGLTSLVIVSGGSYIDNFISVVENSSRYDVSSNSESGVNSLGNALVVNQILPIRAVVGIVYLLLFPLPVWTGFQIDSVYHLYKSFNAIYMYFLIPLLGVGAKKIFHNKELRTPPFLFLVFSAIGFSTAIAITSLETRHFGSFLMPILILALLPELNSDRDLSVYKRYLLIFLFLIFILHLTWVALKLI